MCFRGPRPAVGQKQVARDLFLLVAFPFLWLRTNKELACPFGKAQGADRYPDVGGRSEGESKPVPGETREQRYARIMSRYHIGETKATSWIKPTYDPDEPELAAAGLNLKSIY